MLGMLIASLDRTFVAIALPAIVSDLGGLNQLSWVVIIVNTLYQMTIGGVVSLVEDRENDFTQEMFVSPIPATRSSLGKSAGRASPASSSSWESLPSPCYCAYRSAAWISSASYSSRLVCAEKTRKPQCNNRTVFFQDLFRSRFSTTSLSHGMRNEISSSKESRKDRQ
jgi:hypothetical protein